MKTSKTKQRKRRRGRKRTRPSDSAWNKDDDNSEKNDENKPVEKRRSKGKDVVKDDAKPQNKLT
jgi:hypothetical protein